MRLKSLFLTVALAAVPLAAAPVQEATTVIRGATVLTVTGGILSPGAILIRDGKIAEVGASLEVPAGAEVIEADGMFVMPGIIDAHSHIAAESINEGSVSVSSMTGTGDVVDPYDVNIYRELAGGVTTSNILHGSANPIGGLNVVIKHRWGADAAGLVFEGAPPGIKFALGENPKRSRGMPAGVERRYPATRMGVQDVIRQAFTDAEAYRQEFADYDAAKARGERVLPPRRDMKLEPLVEILEGERLVHAHCYRQDEILQLLRLAEEFGFRIATLQHVLEGYKVANEIAAHGAGASTFSDWWGYKVEAYDAIPYNAALMTERGILVSINSDSAEEARHLNQEAAKTVKWGGMTEEQALRMITINPAIQLGGRGPDRFDRGGEGRGPGGLRPPSAEHLRGEPDDLRGWGDALQPREGSGDAGECCRRTRRTRREVVRGGRRGGRLRQARPRQERSPGTAGRSPAMSGLGKGALRLAAVPLALALVGRPGDGSGRRVLAHQERANPHPGRGSGAHRVGIHSDPGRPDRRDRRRDLGAGGSDGGGRLRARRLSGHDGLGEPARPHRDRLRQRDGGHRRTGRDEPASEGGDRGPSLE